MEDPHEIFGIKPGEPVPVVSVEDLKKARQFRQELKARHPDGPVATGMRIWKQVLPEADIMALTHRCGMLEMLECFLEAAYPGGHLSDHALKLASETELTWMPIGVPTRGLGMNIEQFLTQVWAMERTEKK